METAPSVAADERASRSEARRDAFKNLVFIATAVGAAYFLTVSIGIEELEQLVMRAGFWGPLAVILLKMTTIIVVPLSGGFIYAIAGAAFGFLKGTLITFIGDVLGFAIAFYLSRLWGRPILSFFMPRSQMPSVDRVLAQGSALKSFLKARLAFAGLPEVFAYAAGLTAIPFSIFIIAQMALHTPIAALVVLFGDALLTGNPLFFAAATLGALVLAIVGGWWFKRDLAQAA